MTIIATVIDENNRAISDIFVVENDDFSSAEQAAKQSAEKCCIRWSRSSDGQVGFWGPAGASFDPHWYGS